MRQMNDVELEPEERELLKAVESGKYESVMTDARQDDWKAYARRTVKENLDAERNDPLTDMTESGSVQQFKSEALALFRLAGCRLRRWV